MNCFTCKKNPAIIDKRFGVLPCQACQDRHSGYIRKGELQEFTSESIKQQRKEFGDDIMPWENRGELNKAKLDRYGAKEAKKHGFTDKEIKHAKYVWNSEKYYKDY